MLRTVLLSLERSRVMKSVAISQRPLRASAESMKAKSIAPSQVSAVTLTLGLAPPDEGGP